MLELYNLKTHFLFYTKQGKLIRNYKIRKFIDKDNFSCSKVI